MLKHYQSNRLEYLADLLGELTRIPLGDPLAAELIVVPHPGMGRWLSLRLAESAGICANIRFPLPAGFIWELLHQLLGLPPSEDRFSPGTMQWVLYDLLSTLPDEPQFQAVQGYLGGPGGAKCYELSRQLSRCFDQYLVYRPDWIRRWQRGDPAVDGDQWQSELWRCLNQRLGGRHWVDLQRLAIAALDRDATPGGLPERVSLFGVHTLSPGYLQLLERLARWTDVHVYRLNPCKLDWTGILDPSTTTLRELGADGEPQYWETGNPLLASWGGQGRDFYRALLATDGTPIDIFDESRGGSMLHQVQDDILNLRDGTAGPRRILAPDDTSIRVHSCHTPMREVEVLRDQLLDLLDQNPGWQADDILVMIPDLDQYAPYVEAVFGAAPVSQRIPFSIADRSVLAENPLIGAFLRMLEIPAGRYQSDELLALLEVPAIHRRFRIASGDLPVIRRWIRECGIRWGRDGAHKRDLGMPEEALNSWQSGLDRMLLGYALPGGEERLFQGILPYDEIEGSGAQVLGGLSAFIQALFELTELLGGHHPMADWGRRLGILLGRFFDPMPEDAVALQQLRGVISELVANVDRAALRASVDLEIVRRHLSLALDATPAGGGFLGSGVTFCALTPMRSLPFEVICLLGMNNGSFPRDPHPPGFDLMAGNYRPGDRPRRIDDRYLFLETLISARSCLYISFTGQDVRDNTSLPPSVFVSELIDYLGNGFVTESGSWPQDRYPVNHPLQPFGPRYFQPGSDLFSYASEMLPAARASLSPAVPDQNLLTQPLPSPSDEWRQLELDQLVYFFSNPTRYLLKTRLGMEIDRAGDVLETRDPFEFGWFQRESLGKRLLEAELPMPGLGAHDIFSIERAAGRLPHGQVGRQRFRELFRQAREMGPMIRQSIPKASLEKLPVDVSLGEFRLTGTLLMGEKGIWGFSFQSLPDSRLIGLWIRHLVLNLVVADDRMAQTTWVENGRQWRLPPLPSAQALLNDLLVLYWNGLHEPLHFFPRSSAEYARCLHQGRDADGCLAKARAVWFGGYSIGSEYGNDPYYRLAFPRGEVLDVAFQTLSRRVFEPLLNVSEED